MRRRGSAEINLGCAVNNSENMQGVNMLVEDKGGDGGVMTSLLRCALRTYPETDLQLNACVITRITYHMIMVLIFLQQ